MKRIGFGLFIILSACSPLPQAREPGAASPEAALEAPIMPRAIVDCPAGELARDDGIGGTGCR